MKTHTTVLLLHCWVLRIIYPGTKYDVMYFQLADATQQVSWFVPYYSFFVLTSCTAKVLLMFGWLGGRLEFISPEYYTRKYELISYFLNIPFQYLRPLVSVGVVHAHTTHPPSRRYTAELLVTCNLFRTLTEKNKRETNKCASASSRQYTTSSSQCCREPPLVSAPPLDKDFRGKQRSIGLPQG